MFKKNIFQPFESAYVKSAFRELNKAMGKDGYALLTERLSPNVADALVSIGRDYHNRMDIKFEVDVEDNRKLF